MKQAYTKIEREEERGREVFAREKERTRERNIIA